MQNGPNWCKSSCHEIASEFFTTNALDPPPLDPKVTFCCVSYYLGAFMILWLPYETRCTTDRTSAKVRSTKSRQNCSQRTHPIHPHWTLNWCFGAFHTIWVHSGPFGCLANLVGKCAELVQMFEPRSRVRIFRNEQPDPPHLSLNWHFGVFHTIWVHSGPFGCLTKLGG